MSEFVSTPACGLYVYSLSFFFLINKRVYIFVFFFLMANAKPRRNEQPSFILIDFFRWCLEQKKKIKYSRPEIFMIECQKLSTCFMTRQPKIRCWFFFLPLTEHEMYLERKNLFFFFFEWEQKTKNWYLFANPKTKRYTHTGPGYGWITHNSNKKKTNSYLLWRNLKITCQLLKGYKVWQNPLTFTHTLMFIYC